MNSMKTPKFHSDLENIIDRRRLVGTTSNNRPAIKFVSRFFLSKLAKKVQSSEPRELPTERATVQSNKTKKSWCGDKVDEKPSFDMTQLDKVDEEPTFDLTTKEQNRYDSLYDQMTHLLGDVFDELNTFNLEDRKAQVDRCARVDLKDSLNTIINTGLENLQSNMNSVGSRVRNTLVFERYFILENNRLGDTSSPTRVVQNEMQDFGNRCVDLPYDARKDLLNQCRLILQDLKTILRIYFDQYDTIEMWEEKVSLEQLKLDFQKQKNNIERQINILQEKQNERRRDGGFNPENFVQSYRDNVYANNRRLAENAEEASLLPIFALIFVCIVMISYFFKRKFSSARRKSPAFGYKPADSRDSAAVGFNML